MAYSDRRGFAALAFLMVLGSGLVQMLVIEGGDELEAWLTLPIGDLLDWRSSW